jgi:hypothetical protein
MPNTLKALCPIQGRGERYSMGGPTFCHAIHTKAKLQVGRQQSGADTGKKPVFILMFSQGSAVKTLSFKKRPSVDILFCIHPGFFL